MTYKFLSRYHGHMITWPIGSDQVVRFSNNRFTTEDPKLAAHLRTIKGVTELPAGASDEKPVTTATDANQQPISLQGEGALLFMEQATAAGVCRKEKGVFFYGADVVGSKPKQIEKFLARHPEVAQAIQVAMKG